MCRIAEQYQLEVKLGFFFKISYTACYLLLTERIFFLRHACSFFNFLYKSICSKTTKIPLIFYSVPKSHELPSPPSLSQDPVSSVFVNPIIKPFIMKCKTVKPVISLGTCPWCDLSVYYEINHCHFCKCI